MAELELEACMDLCRRLQPAHIERTLDSLCPSSFHPNPCSDPLGLTTSPRSLLPSGALVPDAADDLLGSVDQPLKILKDETHNREYLACDYNRDQTADGEDAYRFVLSSSPPSHLVARDSS